MKNNILSILSTLTILLFVTSCKDEPVVYDGDAFLHFNKGTETTAVVEAGSGFKTVTIDYGTVQTLSSDAQVTLVADKQFSTAVEGTDFQIVNPTQTLQAGKISGQFQVRLLESGATTSSKLIILRLKSNTIANANFNQTYVISYTKKCPVSQLYGNFTNTEAWFNDPGGNFSIVEKTPLDTQNPAIVVKEFFGAGLDLVAHYNPLTYVVTVDNQNTGVYSAANGGYIWAKQSTDATQVSYFNPCTREVRLFVNYAIPNVGGWGNQKETFIGN